MNDATKKPPPPPPPPSDKKSGPIRYVGDSIQKTMPIATENEKNKGVRKQ